jgi:hypothetical protein
LPSTVVAVLAIADPVKATTPDALCVLAAEKIRIVMRTGDNRTTAQAMSRRLGSAEAEAEVLPDQKSAVVEKLCREGRSSPWRATAWTTRQRCGRRGRHRSPSSRPSSRSPMRRQPNRQQDAVRHAVVLGFDRDQPVDRFSNHVEH